MAASAARRRSGGTAAAKRACTSPSATMRSSRSCGGRRAARLAPAREQLLRALQRRRLGGAALGLQRTATSSPRAARRLRERDQIVVGQRRTAGLRSACASDRSWRGEASTSSSAIRSRASGDSASSVVLGRGVRRRAARRSSPAPAGAAARACGTAP